MANQTDAGGDCRLVELRAQNFLRLKAVDLRPGGTGKVMEITGANGDGKTSVLRALWSALKGKSAAPPVAVRAGAPEGTLRLDLGRATVERTITPGANGEEAWTLKVTLANGRRLTNKPQGFLDALVGEGLWLDPMEFVRWPGAAGDKQRADSIKRLVPGFDFDANAEHRATAFAERTDWNRDARRERDAALAITLPEGPEPEAVDVAATLRDIEAKEKENSTIAERKRRREEASDHVDKLDDEIEQLQARLVSLKKQRDEFQAKLAAAPALPEPHDLTSSRARVALAAATNEARQLFAMRRRHEASAAEYEAAAAKLTERIDALDKAKADAIAAAKLPISGLAFDGERVTLNGLPFQQASTAEKIRTAMAVAMATAGDLKVVMIDEGSELDSKSLKLVGDMVKDTPFVVLVCRVDESGERGLVIEDGVSRPGKAQ